MSIMYWISLIIYILGIIRVITLIITPWKEFKDWIYSHLYMKNYGIIPIILAVICGSWVSITFISWVPKINNTKAKESDL